MFFSNGVVGTDTTAWSWHSRGALCHVFHTAHTLFILVGSLRASSLLLTDRPPSSLCASPLLEYHLRHRNQERESQISRTNSECRTRLISHLPTPRTPLTRSSQQPLARASFSSSVGSRQPPILPPESKSPHECRHFRERNIPDWLHKET